MSQLTISDRTMNTYFRTAAFLACLFALGGLGDELPTVDLCRKNITDSNLQEELDKLPTEKNTLELCHNQLKSFDRDLFQRFKRLEDLVFDDNPDLGFPPDGSSFLVIESLTKLQCVRCNVEKIFNRSLQDLPKIERINLTHNRITDIETLAFQKNRELQLIDLKDNLLVRLPNELIEGLRKLEEVDLSFNKKLNVDQNQSFLVSNYLKVLKCVGCGFTLINEKTFAKLPALRELDLSRNAVIEIQNNAFQPTINLEILRLQNNKLESVYVELLNKDKLRLCLDNNTDQLLCEIQKLELWHKFHCQNETTTEVDCNQFTEPPTEPTTVQTETSVSSLTEKATTTIKTTTVITSTTEVTTTTSQKAPAEPMGISDWYISSYLTIIILTQIGALVILMGVWLKMKKYDSDPELDSLAENILNPSTIYKPLY